MTIMLKGISSMATRQVLAELARGWQERSGHEVAIESVGGVDAARRVAAGEAFDVVFLAADALAKLAAAGHALADTRVDLVSSSVAIAVREGAPRPDVSSEDALRQAVLAAPTVGYSTGPSGVPAQSKRRKRSAISPGMSRRPAGATSMGDKSAVRINVAS